MRTVIPAWVVLVVALARPRWRRTARRRTWRQRFPAPGSGCASAFESVRTQHYPFDFGPTDHYIENRDSLDAPKYHVLFRLWKKEGDAALAGLASGAIQDAVQAGAGRIEMHELGHRYGHLSPLAAVS